MHNVVKFCRYCQSEQHLPLELKCVLFLLQSHAKEPIVTDTIITIESGMLWTSKCETLGLWSYIVMIMGYSYKVHFDKALISVRSS